MKRAVLVPLTLVLALVPGAAAHAAAVGKATGQSRAEVVSYWTAAKMKSAVPRERAKPGGAGGGKTQTYPYTALAPSPPYTAYPTSTNGKVFFTEGTTRYVCSGTALASANKSVVWTAGHCVNAGPGPFHTNWMFVPAYLNGAEPYGRFTATDLGAPAAWVGSGDFRYDVGAATVGTSTTGFTLIDTIKGGRALRTGQAVTTTSAFTLYGYPQAPPFDGQTLRGCGTSFGLWDPYSAEPKPVGVGCNMTGGSSGGAWLNGAGEVVSVNSYGYGSLKNVMFGPQQGTEAASVFAAAGG